MGDFTEKIQVVGADVVDRVKELMAEGDVRRIVVRNEDGKQLFAMPMNAGAAVGAGVVLAAPALAVLGAAAGLLTNLTIEVERTDSEEIIVEVEEVEIEEEESN